MRGVFVACITCLPAVALAQGRIITERSREPPDLYPDEAVLYVKRTDVVVGDCDPKDAGADAATDAAAAADAVADADADADADAGVPVDAGTCTTIPGPAVTMIVQPKFTTGPDGTRFALFFATPAPPLYSVESTSLFAELAEFTAPRIEHRTVEVEDPSLGHTCDTQGCFSPPDTGGGCGGGYGPTWEPPDVPDGGYENGDGGVDIMAVGDYEVLQLSVADTTSLAAWLDTFDYAFSQADLDAIGPYIARGDTITVVRVAIDGAEDGALRPLGLTWPGTDVRPPLALVRPVPDTFAELTVYISAEGRYQLPDARIAFAGRTYASPRFLTRNDLIVGADRTIDRDPLAARISGDPEDIPVNIVEDIVRVPVMVDCSDHRDRDVGCCSECSASGRRRVRWDAIFVSAAALLALRRRRRR